MIASPALAAMLAGCRQSTQEQAAAPVRTDVPLRVVLCGTDADQKSLVRGWSAVNEQQLEVTLVEYDRASSKGVIDRILKEAKGCDVLLYPQLATAALYAGELVTPVLDSDLELAEQQGGDFLATLTNGISQFAGQCVAIPLGDRQPALILDDPIDPPTDWDQYHRWVESVEGVAAEPLADGWAAQAFLWRAATNVNRGWLFDRQAMSPQIDAASYQQTLTQMRETARLYQIERSTPEQIWERLGKGELKGGIAFALGEESPEVDLSFVAPPMESAARIITDPFSPVASLSSSCRQSAASKRFVRWLSGGEGSQVVRNQMSGMSVTRVPSADKDGSETLRPYDNWLRDRLRNPNVIPTLKILAADEYYDALDRQIVRCLEGDAEPAEALAEARLQWQQIGRRVGLKKQQRAWRQIQGMTA